MQTENKYIVNVKLTHKDNKDLFSLLKINKVDSEHKIGKVIRYCLFDLKQIIKSNPHMFESRIKHIKRSKQINTFIFTKNY